MIYIAGAWNEQGKSAFVRAREKGIALIEMSVGRELQQWEETKKTIV